MNNWTSGYIDELPYSQGFYRQTAPSIMQFAAMCHGRMSSDSFDGVQYCDLGCGQGYSTALLAAANPDIQFHAVDFNPEHIANARRLASDAALTNVTFHEAAFAELRETDALPKQFDYIVLHGVLSWISAENRQHIVDFISQSLKPGGLVYASYNAMPGWAVTEPMRRILVNTADRSAGPIGPRIGASLKVLETLAEIDADFFKHHVSARSRLKNLARRPHSYLAHEFFNRDWHPFYFEDLAAELSGAKLSFVGSVNLLETVDDLTLSPEQQGFLASEADLLRRQGLRDFIVNQLFRCDLFAKGAPAYSDRRLIEDWLERQFVMTSPTAQIPSSIDVRSVKIDLTSGIFPFLISSLDGMVKSTGDLFEEGKAIDLQWEQLMQAVIVLVGAGLLQPCPAPQGGSTIDIDSCLRFNAVMCRLAQYSDDYQFLASPVTGSGVALTRIERLFMLAMAEGSQDANTLAQSAWRIIGPQQQRLVKNGRMLETDEENLAELKTRASEFCRRKMPILRLLQVVA